METNNYQRQHSCNANASDLDEETNIKLRGDAIGDTSYSQSFVLKTLLKFSDLQWCEELEEDLCFLWDMTVEEDVCKYLFEISFPSLACAALEKYTENRFIEILIGILTNILCANCEKNITQDEMNVVFRELATDDHLILIQVVKLISSLSHIFNNLPFISRDVLDKLIFILYNSTNNDLLIKTLEAMSKITSDFKLDKNLINIEIIKSSVIAYKSIINQLDEFGFDTKDKQLSCKYLLTVASNFCAYIDHCDNNLLIEFESWSNIFFNEIIKILNYFSHEENLLPITDEVIFYISALQFILETLNVNYLSDIFIPLLKIICIVFDFKDEVLEFFDTVVELVCYFFVQGTSESLYKDLRSISANKAKQILNIVKENQHNFNLDNNLQAVLGNFNSPSTN